MTWEPQPQAIAEALCRAREKRAALRWRLVFAVSMTIGFAGLAASMCSARHTPDGDDTITIRIHGCGWAK